jgi:hypothetical protein
MFESVKKQPGAIVMAFFIAIALLIFMPMKATAAGVITEGTTVGVGNVEASRGETVDLPLYFSTGNNAYGMGIVFTVDPGFSVEAFTAVNEPSLTIEKKGTSGLYYEVYIDYSNFFEVNHQYNLTLTIKVAEDVELGEHPVGLTPNTGFYDENYDDLWPSLVNGSITVVEGTTTPEPEVGEPGSGDLDGSGVTTSGALQVARAVISGTTDWSEAKIDAADIDRDGVLTMSDVIRILRLAAGLT